MRTRRIEKKLHRYWLDMEIIDLSQNFFWRKMLFNSDFNEPIYINSENCDGVSPDAIKAIKKYNLEYIATKELNVDSTIPESSFNNCVIFVFRSKKFPSVVMKSINNTSIV